MARVANAKISLTEEAHAADEKCTDPEELAQGSAMHSFSLVVSLQEIPRYQNNSKTCCSLTIGQLRFMVVQSTIRISKQASMNP